MDALAALGIEVTIGPTPNEVDPAIPFAEDERHASYDAEAVHLFWRQLVQVDRVLGAFRARYTGKVSPVHLFWGAMDLACTRFSGRHGARATPAARRNCGDWVMVEGYSHELSSCGFWAGGGEEGAFYAYAYPEPDGFADHPVTPGRGRLQRRLPPVPAALRGGPHGGGPRRDAARLPAEHLRGGRDHGGWDRDALEYAPVEGARPGR